MASLTTENRIAVAEVSDDLHHEASVHLDFLGHHPEEHHADEVCHAIEEGDFQNKPRLFHGMEEDPVKEPKSFVFQHIVKKTKEFVKTREALSNLHSRHNTYAEKIMVHPDIPYMAIDDGLDKHKLDVWVPIGAGTSLKDLPIVVHFHGGGWIRGDRKDEFRGAPAACRQYASNGIVAVAPSYRLRNPGHMEDAVAAVEWVLKHASLFGANSKALFISGHSAGGNIVGNLAVGTWLDSVLLKYNASVIGAICISGVYSLLNPLGGIGAGIKNRVFNAVYRKNVFGDDLVILARHSPCAQIRMLLGEEAYPKSECKVCKLAHKVVDWLSANGDKSDAVVKTRRLSLADGPLLKHVLKLRSTGFMILNAEDDMGLRTDGKKFVDLLSKAGIKDVTYSILPGRTHASIALDDASLESASEFVLKMFQNRK